MFFKKEKNYDYFDYFIRTADYACQAASHLCETLSSFDTATFPEKMTAMHEIEHFADNDKHTMMARLSHEFISPIEREDIVELSQHLDDVVDSIDDVLICMDMYCLKEVRSEAVAFADLILKACQALHETVTEFRNFKTSTKLREGILAVNTIESEGDRLYSDCVRALFRSEDIGAKAVIAWSAIYNDLESCLDACEHSADVIESVVMKNT